MDFKKTIITRARLWSLILSVFVFGWSQSVKAQYNLQLDSVITDSYQTVYTTQSQTETYTVPDNKVWKISVLKKSTDVSAVLIDNDGDEHSISNSTEDLSIYWLNSGTKIQFRIPQGRTGGAEGGFSNMGDSVGGFLSVLQFSTQ